jgi:hypothetical protein
MGMDGEKCPWCGLEHREYEPDGKVSSGESDRNGSKDVEGKGNAIKE